MFLAVLSHVPVPDPSRDIPGLQGFKLFNRARTYCDG
jgi:hypothetical protein